MWLFTNRWINTYYKFVLVQVWFCPQMCFLTNLGRKGLFLELFDFGIVDKALWCCIFVCKSRFVISGLVLLSQYEREWTQCAVLWDHGCPAGDAQSPCICVAALLSRSLLPCDSPTFPHSSWASFFLPSFLAPSLLSVSPQWILILPFATQPSVAALFSLCLLYTAMQSWYRGHKFSSPAS